jgi:DNA-directed RNA polymerase subunit RPC12/RpoP
MSRSDEEESLYDWYINANHRNTCPRCSNQKISEIAYAQDKNGIGVIYRCLRCLYEYGIDAESGQSHFDKNSKPTLYWE